MLTAYTHSHESGWTQVGDLAQISDHIGGHDSVLWAWADVATLTQEDLRTIAEEFGLHELAVEDAVSLRQRPKLEAYESHLFAVMHQLDLVEEQLEAHQIACFIGSRFVLTLHDASNRTVDTAFGRVQHGARAVGQGTSFVMHALLDTIVDDYQAIADRLEVAIEDFEEQVLGEPDRPLQREMYALKQQLARLRRYVVPGERVLASFIEPNGPVVNERTSAHFRDVHDHLRRIIEQIGNVQALVDAISDLQRAEQANALNEVTKRLTGWAAIIAVPTFIASVYGMNFELVPEDGEITGFFFALGLMFASGVSLYVYLRRRQWI